MIFENDMGIVAPLQCVIVRVHLLVSSQLRGLRVQGKMYFSQYLHHK